jgi:hypothetical protein
MFEKFAFAQVHEKESCFALSGIRQSEQPDVSNDDFSTHQYQFLKDVSEIFTAEEVKLTIATRMLLTDTTTGSATRRERIS